MRSLPVRYTISALMNHIPHYVRLTTLTSGIEYFSVSLLGLFFLFKYVCFSDQNGEIKLPPLVAKSNDKPSFARRIFHRNNPHPRINFPFLTGDRVKFYSFIEKAMLSCCSKITTIILREITPRVLPEIWRVCQLNFTILDTKIIMRIINIASMATSAFPLHKHWHCVRRLDCNLLRQTN